MSNPITDHGVMHCEFDFEKKIVIEIVDKDFGIPWWKQHGWLLWIAWGPLALLQIFSGRYVRMYWKVNMWTHIVSGVLILILTSVYTFLAFSYFKWKIRPTWHDWLGTIDLILIFILDGQGLALRLLQNRLKWRTPWILNLRITHQVLSYVMILVSQAAILTGGLSMVKLGIFVAKPLIIAYLAVFFVFWFFCEGYFQRFIR